MKRGGEQQSAQGFTIVETLIVLAVTGSLFVMAALTINGRQNKTDFQVGVRGLKQQIQQIVNETVSGYYPNNTDFSCQAGAGNNVKITDSSSNTQGSNSECVFGGKALALSVQNPTKYTVYSMAGRRLDSSNADVSDASKAWLTVIQKSTIVSNINNGLEYVGANVDGTGFTSDEGVAVAFLSGFAGSGTSQQAGVQQLNLHNFSRPWPANTQSDSDAARSWLDTEATTSAAYPKVSKGIGLCFKSGGTDQSGLITITNGLEVTLDIKNGTTCGA